MPNKPHKVVSWLEIDELSACGSPAVEGAKAVILKSADATDRVAKARADFAGVVHAIAKRDGCPQHMAMAKARQEHPSAFEAAYSGDQGGVLGDQQLGAADTVSKARSDLMGIAWDIAKTEGVPRHVAMQRARLKRPDLFEAL
jgi:hypothetical protein